MTDANYPPLLTPRLLLRPMSIDDAEALFRIHHEPGAWTHFKKAPPATLEEERAKIQEHLANYPQQNFGIWMMVLRETGESIGRSGLMRRQMDGLTETELGYLLSPRFWGQRLASEAARALRDYAWQTLGLTRLISQIAPENVASQRVAMAVGMQFQRHTLYEGHPHDVYQLERSSAG
jgi:ribosomal-protein-alanine N-acetyltransferase